MRGAKRLGRAVAGGVMAAGLALVASGWSVRADEAATGIEDHFKYGSVGAEERNGLPYWIWRVLPEVFEDKLPPRPGRGYERLGFLGDGASHGRPIGASFRSGLVDLVGLNCATCHVGTYRETASSPRRVVLGMPANQMDLQAYANFLTACAEDPRFEPDTIVGAIRKVNPDFGVFSRLGYRLFVVRRARDGIRERAKENAWFAQRPPFGPGRVDTFTPYRVMRKLPVGTAVGTVDLPSLWNQRPRQGLWLHWDGNNDLVEERNKSAAIGAGATPDSLDLPSMARIEGWIMDLKPPPFPADRVDRSRLEAGRQVYVEACASCHEVGAPRVGQVTPLSEVGTDGERLDSFSSALAAEMNKIGEGHPWRFTHFRKTNGYANAPLDGLWLRAPYLHNGSVPTLRALLFPEERPATFYRAYDVYDFEHVGFVSSGEDAEREGVLFDTGQRGNSNRGHVYGATLSREARESLLEYLKTL
jgi:mono/diheme cytochrome c family protein